MGQGPPRKQEVFDREVVPSRLERTVDDLDRRFSQPRAVHRAGRAAWTRDVDAATRPTHRQVFRTTGGVLRAKEKRNVMALDQDGRIYLRAGNESVTPGGVALNSIEIENIRRVIARFRLVGDPETDS